MSEVANPFGTGAHISPDDKRDVPFAAFVPPMGVDVLPTSHFADVSNLPVENQKKNGSCVGHAGAKYKQLLDYVETGKIHKLSPRFLYAVAKCRDGYAGEGTYPRLVAQILKDIGCATETTVPNNSDLPHESYVYNRNESKMPPEAKLDAKPFKIQGYAFPSTKSAYELKQAILKSNGAMLLMRLGEEWWKDKQGNSTYDPKYIVPIRPPKSIVSGHEVYLYGYEDVIENGVSRTRFHIFNSWSTNWANTGKGYFYFDEYVQFLDEAITFVDLPNTIEEFLTTMPEAKNFKHIFTADLSEHARGEEVKKLQTFLMFTGSFDRTLYAQLLTSNELGYWKPKGVTSKAVYDFQVKYAVAPMSELNALKGSRFGSKSRARANELIKAGLK